MAWHVYVCRNVKAREESSMRKGSTLRSALPTAALAVALWMMFGFPSFSGAGAAFAQDEPVIDSISIEPASPVTGDELRAVADVTTAVPGEQVKLVYSWKIDSRVVQEGESDTLHEPVKRGNVVGIEARVADGQGGSVSNFVLVGNAAPAVKVAGQKIDADGNFEALIEGTDPEGDQITYVLRNAPAGMTIDPASGVIHWSAGQQTGVFSIEVLAKDEQGAETSLSYQVKISRETEEKKATQ